MDPMIRVKPTFDVDRASSALSGVYPVVRGVESRPEVTERILSQALGVKSKELDVAERISVFRSHTSIACDWVRNRGFGERNIDISSNEGGWFGRSFHTRVRIS